MIPARSRRVYRDVHMPTKSVDVDGIARTIFSQIIQGFDAAILHEAVGHYVRDARAAGVSDFIVSSHDSYTVPPENTELLDAAVIKAMKDVMGRPEADVHRRLYNEILSHIEASDLDDVAKAELRDSIDPPPAKGKLDLAATDDSFPVWIEGESIGADADAPPVKAAVPVVVAGRRYACPGHHWRADRGHPDQQPRRGLQDSG